jgi:hypothetical protein
MTAHGAEHSKRQFGLPFDQRENAFLLDQEHLGWFDGSGVSRIARAAGKSHFGKRIAGSENVYDLFLPRGVDSVNVDCSSLDYVKAVSGVACVKQIFPFLKRLHYRDCGYVLKVSLGQANKQLTAAQGINDRDLF